MTVAVGSGGRGSDARPLRWMEGQHRSPSILLVFIYSRSYFFSFS